MAVLGAGALAMWWDMSDDAREDFEDWHSHEHFPERLAVPGFQRATRWSAADGLHRFFVLYEVDSCDTLTSPAYLARLNAPTRWSTRMMPRHRNMVRSPCRVVESRGATTAASALTLRFSPRPGEAQRLQDQLSGRFDHWCARPGLTGAHLLHTRTPAISATTEQRMRGGDQAADWILLVAGYDLQGLKNLMASELAMPEIEGMGAQPGAQAELHALRYTAVAADRLHGPAEP